MDIWIACICILGSYRSRVWSLIGMLDLGDKALYMVIDLLNSYCITILKVAISQ